MEEMYDEEVLRRRRRTRRRMELRRRRRRQALIRRVLLAGIMTGILVLVVLLSAKRKKQETDPGQDAEGIAGHEVLTDEAQKKTETEDLEQEEPGEEAADTLEEENADIPVYVLADTEETLRPGDELISSNAVFVDVERGIILAGKEEKSRMVPASMTKVLTLLVAVEHIEDLDAQYTMAAEAIDYSFKYDCSCAGFEKGEVVTVRDLLYGTVLPSGAEAAMGLALYVSGSQEAFMDLMNGKLEELGLSDTAHFTNCVGVYEDDHYCTACDMAVIMQAALKNETCREVLSAHTYLTSETEQHPEGLLLSNWFLRRIEDKDTGGEVIAGKTGYVDRSGFCAVSYGTDAEGASYICVTANASGNWTCINDHTWLYKHFSEQTETDPA